MATIDIELFGKALILSSIVFEYQKAIKLLFADFMTLADILKIKKTFTLLKCRQELIKAPFTVKILKKLP